MLPPAVPNQLCWPKGPAADDFGGITFAPVVVIVSVEVAVVAELLNVTEVGLREQPMVALLEAHVKATVPLKPLAAVAVMVEVPVLPAAGTVAGVSVKE
jgi:hypothetical protein